MADTTIRPPVVPLQPGAFSGIDASALAGLNVLRGRPVLALLGASAGGIPNVPMYFSDLQALKSVLRSGPLFDCARFAMQAGALPVCVVRAGVPIQGVLALAGATSAPVTLTSRDYGVWTTGIKATVGANNLVTITYLDPNGITFTETYAVGSAATPQNIVDAINGVTPGFTASQYVTASVTAGTAPLTVAAVAPLASGSDGSALSGTDWTNALKVIETEDVQMVAVATGDATVHAQASTHCDAMSTTLARHERRFVGGAVLAESTAAQVTRMASLRSRRVQLIYPGLVDLDGNGAQKTYDPFYAAARVAGQHCALPDPATSLTHAPVGGMDVERKLSTIQGGDVDTLLAAGVSPITPKPGGGLWLVDSLSGYNTDDIFRDFHKIGAADEVARRSRAALEDAFTGKKSLENTSGDVQTLASATLQKLKDETVIRAFLPAQVAAGATPKDYLVTLPVMLPDTVKFIYISVALQPASTLKSLPAINDSVLA